MSPQNDDLKRAIRAEFRERRQTIAAHERDVATSGLTEQLKELVAELNPRTISCYLPTRDEPDTSPFVRWAHDAGIRVLLPISRADGLLDWVASDGTETEPGLFGIEEAKGELLGIEAVHEVDLMLIPACAIDRQGMRLGWGRGFFDKTLAAMQRRPRVLAVIFDRELVDDVPADAHDQAVDGVVTPTQTLHFG